jgi:23S rRNA-intervening sequence protein
MTYQRFEEVPVWQKAALFYEATEELLENRDFHGTRGFKDQLDRAALSVSNNIAEGFERGTATGLLAFFYIARGFSRRSSLNALSERASRREGRLIH